MLHGAVCMTFLGDSISAGNHLYIQDLNPKLLSRLWKLRHHTVGYLL